MDKPTRNLIQKATQDARRLLEAEYSRQLEGTFDILPNGHIAPLPGKHLSDAQKIIREKIVAAITHEKAGGMTDAEAVGQYLREAAFTCLNRFAALKMLEARGLVQECVSKGDQSSGFKEFGGLAPGLAVLPDKGYRLYIESLFDELGTEIRVLFDRRDLASLLWPGKKALDGVLEIFNREEITGIWAEDETIGWVYQYFNSGEERKAMRDASQAPRNSRELAVRNQFFTPRYVVAFLTDNTLGRIWYEMRQRNTRLKAHCQYLVRRPVEIFLNPGQPAPETASSDDLSQEELLRQPVHIPHRPLKDPRDIRMLDPACGSLHFGLYAFDLYEIIYEEAWDLEAGQGKDALVRTGDLKPLTETYADKNAFLRDVPRLIIEHNIHGIDIDPRAVQIGTLALWMRAQRSWQHLGIKPADRPRIRRCNIVTAEPMPGEMDMLKEFTAGLYPPVLGQLVEGIFDKMKLAGEAGSLLKIEEEITDAVAQARKQWEAGPKPEDRFLFPDLADRKPRPQGFRFDLSGVDDERFWHQAEDRILEALKTYAEGAENGNVTRRRLFAGDTAQGFAFIDLCRKKYDVVLMNPPFGLGPRKNFEWVKAKYPYGYVDIYAAFLLRGLSLVDGAVGAITSRSWLITKKLQVLRQEILLPRIHSLLDLGWPVMDDATVHSCASVIGTIHSSNPTIPVFDRRLRENKDETLSDLVRFTSIDNVYLANRDKVREIPQGKILYQLPSSLLLLFRSPRRFDEDVAIARQGMKTFDDFRFIRLRTECKPNQIGTNKIWEPLTKGGPYATFYSDLPLVVRWWKGGNQICEVNRAINGQTAQARQASEHYHKCGGTYSRRCKDFGVRALPGGFIIGEKGPAILTQHKKSSFLAIGLLNSRVFNILVNIQANAKQYDTGIVDRLPSPALSSVDEKIIENRCLNAIDSLRKVSQLNESEALFSSFPFSSSIANIAITVLELRGLVQKDIAQSLEKINQVVDRACKVDSLSLSQTLNEIKGIDDEESHEVEGENDEIESLEPNIENISSQNATALRTTTEESFSYFFGNLYGRWDIRMSYDRKLCLRY